MNQDMIADILLSLIDECETAIANMKRQLSLLKRVASEMNVEMPSAPATSAKAEGVRKEIETMRSRLMEKAHLERRRIMEQAEAAMAEAGQHMRSTRTASSDMPFAGGPGVIPGLSRWPANPQTHLPPRRKEDDE